MSETNCLIGLVVLTVCGFALMGFAMFQVTRKPAPKPNNDAVAPSHQ